MNFYVMTCTSDLVPGPVVRLDYDDDMRSWQDGVAFVADDGGFPEDGPPECPVRCVARNPGARWKSMYEVPLVLMKTEMVEILQGLGVDNLQVYPVAFDADDAPAYLAVNIVGTAEPGTRAPLIFRHRRGPHQIMVADLVRQALAGYPDLLFHPQQKASPL